MITSIETHHRYGDKRCVPCGMTKERALGKTGCCYADCPWKHPQESNQELLARYAGLNIWKTAT